MNVHALFKLPHIYMHLQLALECVSGQLPYDKDTKDQTLVRFLNVYLSLDSEDFMIYSDLQIQV